MYTLSGIVVPGKRIPSSVYDDYTLGIVLIFVRLPDNKAIQEALREMPGQDAMNRPRSSSGADRPAQQGILPDGLPSGQAVHSIWSDMLADTDGNTFGICTAAESLPCTLGFCLRRRTFRLVYPED